MSFGVRGAGAARRTRAVGLLARGAQASLIIGAAIACAAVAGAAA
jgi:hypothetical protein